MIYERYFPRSTVTIRECLLQNLVTVIVRKQRNKTGVSHSHKTVGRDLVYIIYVSHTHAHIISVIIFQAFPVCSFVF